MSNLDDDDKFTRDFLQAVEYIVNIFNIKIDYEPEYPKLRNLSEKEKIDYITEQYRLNLRTIELQKDWHNYDNGVLLLRNKGTNEFKVVYKDRRGQYQYLDVNTQKTLKLEPVNFDFSNEITYFVYPFLPIKSCDYRDIFKLILPVQKHDLIRTIVTQVILSLLSLITPISIGILFDYIVPNARLSLFSQIIIILFTISFITTSFLLIQSINIIRLKLRSNIISQSAVWYRLLRLPMSFFREYTIGDLVNRANGMDAIQQEISSVVVSAIVAFIMAFFNVFLIFYYNSLLALAMLAVLAVVIIMIGLVSVVQLYFQRKIQKITGDISGFLYQMIQSIAKIKVAMAESRFFSQWQKLFLNKLRLTYSSGRLSYNTTIVFILINSISLMLVYGLTVWQIDKISLGAFMAFNAIFSQFSTAVIGIMGVWISFIRILPLYERLKPILREIPKSENASTKLLDFNGEISLKDVSFSYQKDFEFVLKDINLQVSSGEMVGLVGESGSGKTSLFRIILGLEQPNSGDILYNGFSINHLNLHELRKNIGIVLQEQGLFQGTILENIIGQADANIDDAWAAAKLALIDEEISLMPMNMQSYIAENGANLSAGQRQRILIARALILKPKLLLLDEATSALDSMTQAKILHHIFQMKITTIFATHRLSTLQDFKKIYRLQQGKLLPFA